VNGSPAGDPAEELLAVGRVARAHGVHGEVSILPLTEVDERFDPGSRLLLGDRDSRTLTVASRRTHRGRPLVRFEEVADRTAAESLAGEYVFVLASQTLPLPEGSFWPHQLVGSEVVTAGGRALGRLREVIHTPANDVWTVETPDAAELLVPALRDVVLSVDALARRIVVAEVPGLTVPEPAPGRPPDR
jgi:16S rRNA processing protein RimM